MNRTEALAHIRDHSNALIPAAEAEHFASAFGSSLSTLHISPELMPAVTIQVVMGREQVACVYAPELACALAGIHLDPDMDATEVNARVRRALSVLEHESSGGRSIPVEH